MRRKIELLFKNISFSNLGFINLLYQLLYSNQWRHGKILLWRHKCLQNSKHKTKWQNYKDSLNHLCRERLELPCSENTFFAVWLHQLRSLLGYADAELLHWIKINVITSNRGSLAWDCSVEEQSSNIQKIIYSITIHLWEFAMVSTATLLLFYNILELSGTHHKQKRKSRGSALIPQFLVFDTKSSEQHFLWRTFTCLSKSLGVMQCSQVAICVHPLEILNPVAEIVEDYLK